MRVELSADAFSGDGFELVVTLIRHFLEGRHEWVVVDPDDLDVMDAYFREHAPTRAADWVELAQLALASQEWSARAPLPPDVSVTRDNLHDHACDLGTSARIVVENIGGDADFLLAVAHVFGAREVVRAAQQGWLKFVQSGGSGEVPRVVRDQCTDFRRVKRVAFLLDSDRWTPDSPSKHEKVAETLRTEGAHGHILRYREIENYVPNRVLDAVAVSGQPRRELVERVRNLRKLVPEQRAHFDMKKGFFDHQTQAAKVPDEQQELYRSLPREVVVVLRKGFGEGLTALLLQEARAGKLKEGDFDGLGPGVCDELREILGLIKKIL